MVSLTIPLLLTSFLISISYFFDSHLNSYSLILRFLLATLKPHPKTSLFAKTQQQIDPTKSEEIKRDKISIRVLVMVEPIFGI